MFECSLAGCSHLQSARYHWLIMLARKSVPPLILAVLLSYCWLYSVQSQTVPMNFNTMSCTDFLRHMGSTIPQRLGLFGSQAKRGALLSQTLRRWDEDNVFWTKNTNRKKRILLIRDANVTQPEMRTSFRLQTFIEPETSTTPSLGPAVNSPFLRSDLSQSLQIPVFTLIEFKQPDQFEGRDVMKTNVRAGGRAKRQIFSSLSSGMTDMVKHYFNIGNHNVEACKEAAALPENQASICGQMDQLMMSTFPEWWWNLQVTNNVNHVLGQLTTSPAHALFEAALKGYRCACQC